MSSIDARAPFFPQSKTGQKDLARIRQGQFSKKNSYERSQQLNNQTAKDARVSIPESIRDFSRIKKVADAAPPIDNSAKIASLKAQIQAGTYKPDYDAVADKLLATEY